VKLDTSTLLLTATDLSKFSACRRATLLDREVAYARLAPAPYRDDPAMKLLEERGRQHEARYRALLEQRYREPVFQVPCGPLKTATEWDRGTHLTLAAMENGYRVIFQAPLRRGVWCGRADFLERVDHEPGSAPSTLGDYHYRAIDTKLAQTPKGTALLQLCVYSEIVGRLQGRTPDTLVVVSPAPPHADGEAAEPLVTELRTADFEAYFRRIRERMGSYRRRTSTPSIRSRANIARFAIGGRAATAVAVTMITCRSLQG
jgi:uncharacterized protein